MEKKPRESAHAHSHKVDETSEKNKNRGGISNWIEWKQQNQKHHQQQTAENRGVVAANTRHITIYTH